MRFHREGIASLLVVTLFSAVLVFCAHYFAPGYPLVHYLAYAAAAFLIIMILQFFRNPPRTIVAGENTVVAPADGKVVVIEEVMETEYFRDRRIQLSIFMSPLNVHINRNPIGGVVKYMKYHPGKYLVAWHPKSSTENERTTVVIGHAGGKEVLFRQIAGAMARRIVYYLREGEPVKQGMEMGFIKFGSRVDVLLPLDAKIKVKLGQDVRGPETILAEL
jgi:phosphatidylserine decarboxylase